MVGDFYGFTGRPFQRAPDPASYFDSLSHRRALSCLGYSLAQGEGIVLVIGEPGAGKSTLVGQLPATLDQTLLTIANIAGANLAGGQFDDTAIVPIIARAFARPPKPRNSTDLDTIERFLQDEARSGRRCLLVVDDAQLLADAALEMLQQLSAIRGNGHPVLQILLVGQPELRNRLKCCPDLERLRQRVTAIIQLDSLEPGEVERYIHHRLICAGWSGKPTFAADVFTEIYAATAGRPARVNQIANRLLLLAAAGQQQHIDGALLARVLAEWRGSDDLPPAGLVLKTRLELALTRCEHQIAELQQAHARTASQNYDELLERLSTLEGRVMEQERTIRHTMTILIEWIERDEALSIAA